MQGVKTFGLLNSASSLLHNSAIPDWQRLLIWMHLDSNFFVYVYLKRHWVPGCWVGSWPLWPRCRLKCYPHPSSSLAPAIVPPASGLQLLQHRFINCRKRRIHTHIKTPRASPWRALIYVLICNNAGLNWSSESTFPLPRTETNPSKGKEQSLILSFKCLWCKTGRETRPHTDCRMPATGTAWFYIISFSQLHDS